MVPNFEKRNGLIIAIVQDAHTLEVLMHAFMNPEAWEMTCSTREAYFWSTSRDELWHKGGTSGNVMDVKAMHLDCDRDCVLLSVSIRGDGNACHTGARSCFTT